MDVIGAKSLLFGPVGASYHETSRNKPKYLVLAAPAGPPVPGPAGPEPAAKAHENDDPEQWPPRVEDALVADQGGGERLDRDARLLVPVGNPVLVGVAALDPRPVLCRAGERDLV